MEAAPAVPGRAAAQGGSAGAGVRSPLYGVTAFMRLTVRRRASRKRGVVSGGAYLSGRVRGLDHDTALAGEIPVNHIVVVGENRLEVGGV
jgi:hypothetical protein